MQYVSECLFLWKGPHETGKLSTETVSHQGPCNRSYMEGGRVFQSGLRMSAGAMAVHVNALWTWHNGGMLAHRLHTHRLHTTCLGSLCSWGSIPRGDRGIYPHRGSACATSTDTCSRHTLSKQLPEKSQCVKAGVRATGRAEKEGQDK